MMRVTCWACLLVACGSSSNDPDSGMDAALDSAGGFATHEAFTVSSADGFATLTVAADSLPVGVDASELRIEPGGAFGFEPATGVNALVEVQLLPDGVVFREPAVLELTHANVDEVNTLVLISEGRVEAVDWGLDVDGSRISANVPHFSDIVATVDDAWGLETVQELEPMIVGGPGSWAGQLIRPADAPLGTITTFGPIDIVVGVESTIVIPDWDEVSNHVLLKLTEPSSSPEAPLEAVLRCTEPGIVEGSASAMIQDRVVVRTLDATSGDELGRTMARRDAAHTWQRAEADCTGAAPETSDNCNDSISSEVCTYFAAHVDIVGQAVRRMELTAASASALFGNTAFECGEVLSDTSRTVCTAAPLDVPVGGMWALTTKLDAPIPDGDPDRSYIYAAVFESDDQPDNDWVFVDPFDHDYFQGTDRWYQLVWDHAARTWSLTVTQVDASQTTMQVPSAARVFVTGDVITWMIPETELPSPNPEYRLTAFGHDGAFSPADRGGDVTGADPAAPLYEADP